MTYSDAQRKAFLHLLLKEEHDKAKSNFFEQYKIKQFKKPLYFSFITVGSDEGTSYHDQNKSLFRKYIHNPTEEIKNKIVEANKKLVTKLVKEYKKSNSEFEDLYYAGITGLLDAIEQFDPSLGYEFSTFAYFYIRNAIQEENNHGSLVNLSKADRKNLAIISSAKQSLFERGNSSPTIDEIVFETQGALSYKQVLNLISLSDIVVSTDAPLNSDSDTAFIETIPESFDDDNYVGLQYEKLEQCLNELDSMTKDIVLHRYGVYDCQQCTLEELAEKYGVSKDTISRRQNKGIKRLRALMKI